MASNGNDPTTGHPLFPATDAPDLGVDEEILALYATFRGTRMYGSNAEMEAFESAGYARVGEQWFNTTDDHEYQFTSGGWRKLSIAGDTTATLTRSSDLTNGVSSSPLAAAFSAAPTLERMTWTSGQPSRLYTEQAGVFLFDSLAAIGSTSTAYSWYRVNGSTSSPKVSSAAHSAGLATVPHMDVLTLAAGDYVEMMTQSNGDFTLFASTRMNASLLSAR